MIISNKNGTIISDKQTWENAFKEVSNIIHWKDGRSAESLAKHFMSGKTLSEKSEGEGLIEKYLNSLGYSNIRFTHAEIEHESRFDPYSGNGRIQDMII